MKRGVSIIVVTALVGVVTTLSPTSHNFGQTVTNTFSPFFGFDVTLTPGASLSDSIDVSFSGQDAAHFRVATGSGSAATARRACSTPGSTGGATPGRCKVSVTFWPLSLGPKTATLRVADRQGRAATAALTGTGINPICTMTVVLCNYAFLYSGSFQWSSTLQGDYGSTSRMISVNVVRGGATCDGVETEVVVSLVGTQRHVTTNTGRIYGPGLFAVELLTDSLGAPAYQVTASCPSPAWPAAMNRPRTLAELGSDFTESSYPVPLVRAGRPYQYLTDTLAGNRSEAHPDTDPANRVSGSIAVTWALNRS